MDISFIIMPFATVHFPHLGVGLLKSGLDKLGISSKLNYFNIRLAERIGIRLYDMFSIKGFNPIYLSGELIFAEYLFGKKYEWKRLISDMTFGSIETYSNEDVNWIESKIQYLRKIMLELLDDFVNEVLKQQPKLIGFSSTFQQNCASLLLAKKIKEKKNIPIIFGGANCEGEMGYTLLNCFPEIDFICSGEGDIAFLEFAKNFITGKKIPKINGILDRKSSLLEINLTSPVLNMNDLPFPNFDDYFSMLEASSIRNELQVVLPIETSRGCWWGEVSHCTFCGLNGSTMTYRSKSPDRVIDEIKYLTEKYKITSFQVTDNILDQKYITTLFPKIAANNMKLWIFYETKSNLSKEQLRTMKQAGVEAIQPGIESFSDVILRMMKKGVTGLQNIQLLKWCREIGILPHWNILTGFPNEPIEEYEKMANIIPLLVHLPPPGGQGKIQLHRFSPYFVERDKFDIINVRPLEHYYNVFPFSKEILQKMVYYFEFDYKDSRNVNKYTESVINNIKEWRKIWKKFSPRLIIKEIDKNLVVIEDTRPCASQNIHILAGEKAEIYTICNSPHTINTIQIKIKNDNRNIESKNIEDSLFSLCEKNLILHNNGRFLSLATTV